MEFEAAEGECSTPSRREKSLGLLTMKFVSLLQRAEGGRLDLKEVGGTLGHSAADFSSLLFSFSCASPSQMAVLKQRAVNHLQLAGQVH